MADDQTTPSPAWERVRASETINGVKHSQYDADLVDAARSADTRQIEELKREIALTHERLDELDESKPLCDFVPALVDETFRRLHKAEAQVAALSAQVKHLETTLWGRPSRELYDLTVAEFRAVVARLTHALNNCEVHADVEGIAERTACAVCFTEALEQVEQLTRERDENYRASVKNANTVIVLQKEIASLRQQLTAVDRIVTGWMSDPNAESPYFYDKLGQQIRDVLRQQLTEKEQAKPADDQCPRCLGSFAETGGKPIAGPMQCQKCTSEDWVANQAQEQK